MWEIKSDGTLAVDEENDSTVRIALCSDKLFRVKRNYKTVGTFKNLNDAKIFLSEYVNNLNGEWKNDK